MEQDLVKTKTLYAISIIVVTIFCLVISAALSMMFWLSFSNNIYLAILFILFAIVFEITKVFSFIEGRLQRHWKARAVRLAVYILLTMISVLGSAGGLYSLLQQKQVHHAVTSHAYQQLMHRYRKQRH